MSDFVFGTPVICPKCGHEDKVRLFRGVRLKNLLCVKCGHKGLKRNTDYDKGANAMKIELKDFPLNTSFDAAGECHSCRGKLRAKITWIDPEGKVGDVFWECEQCGDSAQDTAGWELAENPVKMFGKEFYPILSRVNVGPCLNCGKLVIGPLVLFLEKGRSGELDFCFPCAKELGILDKLEVKA